MCGIFGYVGDPERARSIDVDRAIAALRHRGPDANGKFFDHRGDLACVFGHTRLAIIDLSPLGNQPMTSADGRFTICYNGEVFNFRQIRDELVGLGHRFVSDCDTEVVLHAYIEWGEEALQRFRGMFAFAIWDGEQQSLFCARDRLGIKPFYYVNREGAFAFASEVRTLVRAGVADKQISLAALDDYLQFGSVQDPRTIFEGVHSLTPGTYVRVVRGRATFATYWTWPAADSGKTFDVEPLHERLVEAVALRLVADVPVGVFLSGGIDSSVVAALAARASSQPIETFSVGFEEAKFDERRFAAEVAKKYGCNHHEILLKPDRLRDELDDVIAAFDQPSIDGANSYFVSEAVAKVGLRVALSGLGGDELFAGYSTFRQLALLKSASSISSRLPASVSRMIESGDPLASGVRRRKIAALMRAGGRTGEINRIMRTLFDEEQRKRLMNFRVEHVSESSNGSSDPINDYSRAELAGYLRNTLLRDTDAMSMAHSLEVRVPLIDHEVVEEAMRVPGRMKLSAATNKPLLRSAVPDLPESAAGRKKMGFTLPWDTWLRGPLRNRVTELLSRKTHVLDAGATWKLWRLYLDRPGSVSFSRVWALALVIAWADANGVEV
ncbi:MAG: asparagine synthase (glutamine-hydrolyzing) [Thermoanaerobaculia bacterium]